MNRQSKINLVRPHAAFSRVLSMVLLSFILYGTTVEAVHKHGNLTPGHPSHSAALSAPGTESTINSGLAGCGECLICQLHQDFSTSVIVDRHTASPRTTRLEISSASSDILHSLTQTPRAGRAPPLAI